MPANAAEKATFWSWIIPAAREAQARTGLPWQVLAGQASIESGYGTSSLARSINNYFGIHDSARNPGPGAVRCDNPPAWCKAFDSATASVTYYANLVANNRIYRGAQQFRHDPYKYITAVWASGYAEHRDYARMVATRMREADPNLPLVPAEVEALWSQIGAIATTGTDNPARQALIAQLVSTPDTPGGGNMMANLSTWALPVAGVVGAAVLVAGGLWWYFTRKGRRRR